jgi:hypothetical protein
MKLHLIDGARNWWRQWSTRILIVQAILTGLQAIDPGTLLAAWNMMPGAVRDYLPAGFVQKTGLVLFALNMAAILLRQVKQKKLEG